MSYNWTSASTPQGRERLKELLDQGHRIVGKVGEFGRITAFWKHNNGYDVDAFLANDLWYHARVMDGIEFLDPSPIQPKEDKDARIKELELVIEHAADCLDRIHEDDDDAWEKIGRIYHNLENKTRYEV